MASFLAIVSAVEALMPGVTHLVGASEISNTRSAPPRVVWVPSGDTFQPGRQRGAPKSLRTRVVAVQALCWGKATGEDRSTRADMAATEALAEALLWAVEDALGGSWDVSAGGWEGDSEKVQSGKAYVLALTFELPLTRPETVATVVAVQRESTLALASGDVTGAPAP